MLLAAAEVPTSGVRVVGPEKPGVDGGVWEFLGRTGVVHPVHDALEALRLHDGLKGGPARHASNLSRNQISQMG